VVNIEEFAQVRFHLKFTFTTWPSDFSLLFTNQKNRVVRTST